MQYGAVTDKGKRRARNEDSLLAAPEERLFAVADGVGGRNAGHAASSLALHAIRRFFENTGRNKEGTWPFVPVQVNDLRAARLITAIKLAHLHLVEEMQEDPVKAGMGTTIAAVFFAGSKAYVAHAGDSRCYRVRGGRLDLLTADHTVANKLRKKFHLSLEQAPVLGKMEHVITRALGIQRTAIPEVDLGVFPLQPDDLFLLCSDGLTLEVTDEEILACAAAELEPDAICRSLLAKTLDRGARDNVTVIVVRVPDDIVEDRFDEDEDTVEVAVSVDDIQ